MIKEEINTKWGTAKLKNNGYIEITSLKEGNYSKGLHRLIWEDFYGFEIPKDFEIHHINNNKLDNCILNLQLIRCKEHKSLHNKGKNHPLYGKHHDKETKFKISSSLNTTGYYRVIKEKNNHCKQGFRWRYQYYEDEKQKYIKCVDLNKLKEKVIEKGLEWMKLDEL